MTDTLFYQKLAEAMETNTGLCLATVVSVEGSAPGKPGFKMLVNADGTTSGTVGGGEAELLVIRAATGGEPKGPRMMRFELKGQPGQKDGTHMVCGGAMEVFLEPLGVLNKLYILGGGHCGQALSRMASQCGFAVTVIDDRPEWASQVKHPSAKVICAPYAEAERYLAFGPEAYIVIMTQGHDHDEQALRICLKRECRYLGLIASKKKVNLFFERLARDGVSQERLAAIYSPIGFDIGSDTPTEIAVSILAQLIAVRSGKTEIKFSANPLK